MHFLLIHHVFLSSDSAGGTRHYEFAKYCVSQGHQFTVIGSDVNYLDAKKFSRERRDEVIDGIHVIRASMPAFIHKSYTLRVVAFVYHMFGAFWHGIWQKKVDLVIGTTPSLFQGVSAYLLAVIKRRPLLLEVRDLWPDFAIEMGILKSRLLIFLARRVEMFLYWRSTHILVNSPAYIDHVQSKGIPRGKISLIPNGVDPSMFDPAEQGSSIRETYKLQGKFVVVYAGAMGPANDIGTIVRAANRLRDVDNITFLLVGDGKSKKQIADQIDQLGLTNVILAGAHPKSHVRFFLGAADACVATLKNIPMFSTTYPNKVFDYMAAGRPTLIAIDGVIRKVIEEGSAGIFVKPGDDADLAEKTLWLLHHPEEARQMKKNAREYVCQHFDRKAHSVQFEKLCSSLVKKSS
jgi:glycosyltransferase involved in cell wall biosynthesis